MRKVFGCVVLTVCFLAVSVKAQENANVFVYKAGGFEVMLLSEGQDACKSSALVGASEEVMREYVRDGFFYNLCNVFLVRVQGKTVLVDTGYGRNLFENLKWAGVRPDEIDAVLLTHSHGDHIGGLLDKEGRATFINAELYVSQAEYDHVSGGGSGNGRVRSVMEAYRERLHLFEPTELGTTPRVLLPGIGAVVAYGHTPGHTMFVVEQSGERVLIWGDIVHSLPIQMPFPGVAMTYDSDSAKAVATRMRVLEYAVANGIPVAGMHCYFPAMGRITKTEKGGYVFTPLK